MKVHPVVRDILDQMAAANRPGLADLPPAEARQIKTMMDTLFGEGPQMHRVDDRPVTSAGAEIPVRVYYPSEKPKGYIVFYHGGGWVIGSVASYDNFVRAMCAETNCIAVSVDYRLAPENPFPAAADDALASALWTVALREERGEAKLPLILCGDSAGGNLAAATAHALLDEGIDVALQVLIYPVIDADLENGSYTDFAEGLYLTKESMAYFWDQYVPAHENRVDPRAAPAKATCRNGLAPAFILTGEFDPLRDEGEAYGEQLRRAGIVADIKRYPGMIHGFLALRTLAEPAAEANRDVYEAIKRVI